MLQGGNALSNVADLAQVVSAKADALAIPMSSSTSPHGRRPSNGPRSPVRPRGARMRRGDDEGLRFDRPRTQQDSHAPARSAR